MKISSMAKSNFKGNAYRYIMYILSNAFAVASFFIFTNFLLHPAIDFRQGLGGHQVAAQGAMIAVQICMVVIGIFVVFFIAYTTGLFIKSRGKEFGLLSLYGMTKKQIRKYVFVENSIIGLISMTIGLLVGGVFSKLFLMVMESFIAIDLYFNISLLALIITSLVYLIIFQLINIFSLLKINNKEIVEQLKTSKKPREIKKFSKKKAILGIGLLLIGYLGAWLSEGAFVVVAMMPVTFIVIVGTYFTVTQFSFYIVDKLDKNKNIKYRDTNIVSLSQLRYKLQDTAKVLFLASILGAITFTATETLFTFYKDVDEIIGINAYEDIIVGNYGDEEEYREVLEAIDREYGKIKEVSLDKKYETEYLKMKNLSAENIVNGSEVINVISQKEFNRITDLYDSFESLDLKENQAFYNQARKVYGFNVHEKLVSDDGINLELLGEEINFDIVLEHVGPTVGLDRVYSHDILVVNNKDYEGLKKDLGPESIGKMTGMKVNDLKKSNGAAQLIYDKYWNQDVYEYDGRIFLKSISHIETRNSLGLILFIGFFISFLFFLASSSVIYFNLFNEIREDKKEYDILQKIGMSEKELNKIINRQLGTIFFIPFIISTSHSFFALKALSNLVEMNLLLNGIIVMLGYFVFQLVYFIFIKKVYKEKIKYA